MKANFGFFLTLFFWKKNIAKKIYGEKIKFEYDKKRPEILVDFGWSFLP